MAKRTQVGVMVRGMGMGMNLLDLFINEIKKQGGEEEILAFLARPRFAANLEATVKAMIDSDWRIPASEMRFLAEEYYRKEFKVDVNFLDEVRNLWWFGPLMDLGISYERFSNDPMSGEMRIPPDLMRELDGKKVEYPFLLREGKYVVVDWAIKDDDEYTKPGNVIELDKVEYLSIAETKHFNFDR